jgi:Tfp pilus assembly protein PilN
LIEINLLPSGEKRRSRPRPGGGARRPALTLPAFQGDPYMAGLGALALVMLVGLGFTYWRVDSRLSEIGGEITRAEADSVSFAKTIHLVAELGARQDTIEQKIEVIREVDERRYVWPHILDEISRALPPYTWLTRITAEEQAPPPPSAPQGDAAAGGTAQAQPKPEVPRGPAFSLEGNAGSTQALTLFMKSLEASPFIRGVTLVTSKQESENGRSFQKFTLEARYEVPDSSTIETVPVITVQ